MCMHEVMGPKKAVLGSLTSTWPHQVQNKGKVVSISPKE